MMNASRFSCVVIAAVSLVGCSVDSSVEVGSASRTSAPGSSATANAEPPATASKAELPDTTDPAITSGSSETSPLSPDSSPDLSPPEPTSPAPATTDTSAVGENEFQRVEADGVSIEVPVDWDAANLDTETLVEAVDESGITLPGAAVAVGASEIVMSYTGFGGDSVIVMRLDVPINVERDGPMLLRQYAQVFGSEPTLSSLVVSGRDAVRIETDVALRGIGYRAIQIVIEDGGMLLVNVTMITNPESSKELVDHIVDSIRVE